MPAVGGLDRRVTLEAPGTRTPDEYGQEEPHFLPVADVWASVDYMNGRKLEAAKQVHPEVTVEVTIRHRDNVTPDMRVNYRGRALNILAVLPSKERNRWLRLLCVERTDAVRDQG